MKETITLYLSLAFKVGLLTVILSVFFLFTNFTTESFDLAKFFVLLIFVAACLILISLKFIAENKVSFVRTPFDLPLILLLAVGAFSTAVSPSPYISLLGSGLKIHGSLISLAVYVLFYFVITQNLKIERQIRGFLEICLWAGSALSAITLLYFFGVKGLPFTPTGSSFSTTAILAMLIPIAISRIITYEGLLAKALNTMFLTIFGLTIALTGSLATYVAAGAGALTCLFALNPLRGMDFGSMDFKKYLSNTALFAISLSLIIIILALILSFIPPLKGVQNPLYTSYKNFPREIALPYTASWKISVSAFRDSPFWGSGPSTYLFDFTKHKPIEFNSTKFWNIRFDNASNEYFQILSTLGGIGVLAFLSLTALFISRALAVLKSKHPANVSLAAGGAAFFILAALHPLTLPVMVIGLLLLACFWVLNWREPIPSLPWVQGNIKEMLYRVASFSHTSEQTIRVEALPSIILILALASVLFAGFFGGKFYMADLHHKNAINAVAQNNGVLAYNELILAEKLNPYNDLYRTDLAQVNFALANAIASAKGPTEASPTGSLTDQDKQNIQVLLQQSVTEGRTATTLSPHSAVNWEILGLLYRQIAGVAQNALLFSLDSYGRAILNDPFNPTLRLNVGGVYYAVKNYELAIRFFTDAINLKPDFANGYYNLSVALRDKGDLNAALQAAEKVVTLVEQDSPDYKVATDYLNDLKSKVSPPTPPEPPAAETSGSLSQKELPKVINLPKPDKIATPEAIKKPSPTPTPSP